MLLSISMHRQENAKMYHNFAHSRGFDTQNRSTCLWFGRVDDDRAGSTRKAE